MGWSLTMWAPTSKGGSTANAAHPHEGGTELRVSSGVGNGKYHQGYIMVNG